MKYYIFITTDIHPIGGIQNYIEGKAAFLKENGWKVKVFFAGFPEGRCKIAALDEFLDGGMVELDILPGKWSKCIRNRLLSKMIKMISQNSTEENEIIIEAHDECFSLWGEILAEKIHAKSMCFICNEKFRAPGKHYVDYLDFFDFKLKRKELTGIMKESLSLLFEGYKTLDEFEKYHFDAVNLGPVRDVKNEKVNLLKKCEWNIAYIGRIEKPYVDAVVHDIAVFCKKYRKKKIQFIIVGNELEKKQLIQNEFSGIENLTLTPLGDLVPIPRDLYKIVDVVIAGSGCAECSALEGVPVIIPDANNCKANGILGYTTFDSLYHEIGAMQYHYDEVLAQVLVDKIQDQITYEPFPYIDPYSAYSAQLEFVRKSNQDKEYFHFTWEKGEKDYVMLCKYCIKKVFPFLGEMFYFLKKIF